MKQVCKYHRKDLFRVCRNFHSAVIEASRQQSKMCPMVPGSSTEQAASSRDQEQIEDLVTSFQTEQSANEDIRKSKSVSHPFSTYFLLSEKKLRTKSSEHYIKYAPNDLHSEKGLSLTDTFDKQVNGAVLDLEGDDAKALHHKSHATVKWYENVHK